MKSLTYITLVAAFVFGMNTSNANALSNNDEVVAVAVTGNAAAYYDEASQVLTLRMIVPEGQDRVMIHLTGRGGEVLFKDKAIVNTRGTIVEIPMAGLAEGTYYLRAKGTQISYSNRIKHK